MLVIFPLIIIVLSNLSFLGNQNFTNHKHPRHIPIVIETDVVWFNHDILIFSIIIIFSKHLLFQMIIAIVCSKTKSGYCQKEHLQPVVIGSSIGVYCHKMTSSVRERKRWKRTNLSVKFQIKTVQSCLKHKASIQANSI